MKIWFILLSMFCTFSSLGFEKSNFTGFELIGEISGLQNGTRVYLIQYSIKDTVAEAKTQNGCFTMRGFVPAGTEYYYIYVDSSIRKLHSSSFLLVNRSLRLHGTIEEWPNVRLFGSTPNDELDKLKLLWDKYRKSSELNHKVEKFIYSNLNSLYIADLILKLKKMFSFESRLKMYESLSDSAKKSHFGKSLMRELELDNKRKFIAEGQIIPDFSVHDFNNKSLNVKEVASKNKLTLIDFWASWCKPCREEIPNLKKVYDKFHTAGFEIFSIALSDKEDNWKQAIIDDETHWIHGRDSNNLTYKIFDIPAIPGFVLIDKNGKLISFQCEGSEVNLFGPKLRGEDLFNTVDSLMKFEREVDALAIQNRPIKIGEKVPDVSFTIIDDKKLIKSSISEYKDRLLILDFWSVYCSTCIAQFEHIKKMQEEFGDKVKILPVGFDGFKDSSIVQFLIKYKGTDQELSLPTAIQKKHDTILQSLFPFSGLPHEVWIDKNGILLAVTDHSAITKENIESAINGVKLPFREKRIRRRFVEENEEVLLKRTTNFGSAFSPSLDSFSCISDQLMPENSQENYRWFWVNTTIFDLYKFVFQDSIPMIYEDVRNKRIILENMDNYLSLGWKDTISELMDNWKKDEFWKKNVLCYELLMPGHFSSKDVVQRMHTDLDDYWNVKSSIEIRELPCIVISFDKEITSSRSLEKNSGERLIDSNEMLSWLNDIYRTQSLFVLGKNIPPKFVFVLPEKIKYEQKEVLDILKSNGLKLIETKIAHKVILIKKRKNH